MAEPKKPVAAPDSSPGSGPRSSDLAATVVTPPPSELATTTVRDPSRPLDRTTIDPASSRRGLGGTVLLSDASASAESARLASLGPVAEQPLHGEPLPPDAPDWMRFGRVISATIEAAIRSGKAPIELRAGIARAWAAWQLGGTPMRDVATIAKLVERTHKALRDALGHGEGDTVANDCTTLIHNGLPGDMRKWIPRERVRDAVATIAAIEDRARARLEGTAKLLGWTDAARAWGAEAIAIAVGEIA